MEATSSAHAKDAIVNARTAYEASPTAENLNKLRELELNPQAVRERLYQLRLIVKQAVQKVVKEALPIRTVIFERAAEFVREEHDALEIQEKKTAERFNVSYEPGGTVKALAQLARSLESRIAMMRQGSGSEAPNELLKGIIAL